MLFDGIDELLLPLIIVLVGIVASNNARFRHRLCRRALLHPILSPWQNLINYADESSFLTITALSRIAFVELEKVLFPSEGAVVRRGRPEMLNCRGKLGLYLLYATSRMEVKFLCMIFGIVPTTCIKYINEMMKLVVKKLKNHEAAKISFPMSETRKQHYADLVYAREPSISNCIGFVDGVAIPVQCSSEILEQNKFCNGYKHDTTVNNVLAFAPDGKVIHAAINFAISSFSSISSASLSPPAVTAASLTKILRWIS